MVHLIRLAPLVIWVCDLYFFTVVCLGKRLREIIVKQGRWFRGSNNLPPGESEPWFIHLSPLPLWGEDLSEMVSVLWITMCCARHKASVRSRQVYILPNTLTASVLRIQGIAIHQAPCNKTKILSCNCSELIKRKVFLSKLQCIAPLPRCSLNC